MTFRVKFSILGVMKKILLAAILIITALTSRVYADIAMIANIPQLGDNCVYFNYAHAPHNIPKEELLTIVCFLANEEHASRIYAIYNRFSSDDLYKLYIIGTRSSTQILMYDITFNINDIAKSGKLYQWLPLNSFSTWNLIFFDPPKYSHHGQDE